jgi:poly(A) polymerase
MKMFPGAKHIGESFGVVQVKYNNYKFEVATFRKDIGTSDGRHPDKVILSQSAEEDAQRRDFTINGIFYDPIKDEILDYVNGKKDIQVYRTIRFIGDPIERIKEDYLRMLRAVRFAVKLNFELSYDSKLAIMSMGILIKKLTPERIFDELNKIFTSTDVGKSFNLLVDLWIIGEIFPEVQELKRFSGPIKYHPEGDVLEHTQLAMNNIPIGAPLHLTYAVMFHDIGKAKTYEFRDGREHYHGHDMVSSEIAEVILKRLKADNKLIENVKYLVENHMRISEAPKMRKSKLKKMMSHPLFFDLLQLHYADAMGSNKDLSVYNFLLKKLGEMDLTAVKEQVRAGILSGEDLIFMGFEPGPLFRIILNDVNDKYLNGEFEDKLEALHYVTTKYEEHIHESKRTS